MKAGQRFSLLNAGVGGERFLQIGMSSHEEEGNEQSQLGFRTTLARRECAAQPYRVGSR